MTYIITNCKLSNALFYLKSYFKLIIPSFLYIIVGQRKLCHIKTPQELEYINERVDYYCKLHEPFSLPQQAVHENLRTSYRFIDYIKKYKPSTFHKAYFFDLFDATKWTSRDYRIAYIPGDVNYTPEVPSFVKSRRLIDNNQNSVIIKLDKERRFMFVKDKKEWIQKKDMIIFSGKIGYSRDRVPFLENYFGTAFFDSGVIGGKEGFSQYKKHSKTILEHLEYKFIMTLEGNGETSNLTWVMSSNSLAVMPKPICETWFMEGKLIPNVHYVEIKPDLSDLKERMNYYISHPKEAEQIIANAHEYVAQFLNEEREDIIQHLVVEKYRYLANSEITKSNI